MLVESHGSFIEAHCIDCKKSNEAPQIKRKIFNDEIPYCSCGGLVKPDIVFFGESLPDLFIKRVRKQKENRWKRRNERKKRREGEKTEGERNWAKFSFKISSVIYF